MHQRLELEVSVKQQRKIKAKEEMSEEAVENQKDLLLIQLGNIENEKIKYYKEILTN